MVRRRCLLIVLLFLVLIFPSNLKLVIAAGPPLQLTFVCHDSCWDETEYCGRDAVVALGKPDMNHDCIVDGLDLALFFPEFYGAVTGPGLSGDFDNNNAVGLSDLYFLSSSLGSVANPCHSIPIPTQCDGNISISFNLNPANIVNNATQSPGTHTAYVVVSSVTALQAIEFGVTTSANITDLSGSFQSGFSGSVGTDFISFGTRPTPLTGAATVARFTYTLTDANPATISIALLPALPWMRNRWTTLGVPVSHEFANINSAGINGPTPGSVASCAPTGTITGTVHLETGTDCDFNGSDTAVSERLVMTTPGSYFGYTDANGNYSIAVPAGNYEVSMFSSNPLSACQDPSLPAAVTAGQVSAGNNFAVEEGMCHDGVWDDGEYCGRDAYTATGFADMNHDCFVDGLDYALFAAQYPTPCGAAELSADLNGDETVNAQDRALMDASLGHAVSPCNSTPIPSQCDGILGLSFNTNPLILVSNATQAPGGPYSVWLVVNGPTNAKSIEFWIKASPNVSLGTVTWFGGAPLTQTSNYCTSLWGVGVFTPLLTAPTVVAKLDYFLSDSSPATISIVPPTPCAPWARNRWVPANGSVSHEFAYVTNVGINGPAPGLSPSCAALGHITGTVYAEVPNNDCAFTSGDTKLANRVVKAVPGPHYAYTDANGDYSFSLLPDITYTVSMDGFNSPWKALSACQSPTYTVPVTANTTSTGNDFALEQSGTLKGRVYSDATTLCAFDGSDVGMAGRQVEANPGSFLAYTDLNGNYSFNLPVGTYTVTLVKPLTDPWAFPLCFAGSYPSVPVTLNTTTTGWDFPLILSGTACNMTTRIASNPISFGPPPCQNGKLRGICPGFEHEFLVWVYGDPLLSNATVPAGSFITVQLDPAFTINSVTADCANAVTNVNAYTRKVTFNTAIAPGTICTVKLHATPSTAGPYTETAVYSPGIACIGTYQRTLSETSRCNSCDPNDMLVQPGCGDNGEVLADEPLTYTTRFQNIGQGPAENIVVESVLDDDLDPSTLYIIQASHTVTGVQLEDGNKLVISFENINLPGTTDPANSHGYVMYSINQDPGLPDGTQITNSASVFFDFNSPVITNTALTTVKDNPCEVTAVTQPVLPTATFLGQNHPNPFNPTTTLEYGLVSFELVSINIYNARGELVRTLVSGRRAPGSYSVEWDGRDQRGNQVASGVYLSRMQAGSFSQTKKLVLLK